MSAHDQGTLLSTWCVWGFAIFMSFLGLAKQDSHIFLKMHKVVIDCIPHVQLL